MERDRERVVVVVEAAEASRAALQWALRNYIRGEDSITLLHVCPLVRQRQRQRRRHLRLRGFQLALSFKELCTGIAEHKLEIVVMEGDVAEAVVSTVNRVGATALIVGLHEGSFLCSASASANASPNPNPNSYMSSRNIRCRIIGVKQNEKQKQKQKQNPLWNVQLEISQVETVHLCSAVTVAAAAAADEPKIPFPIFTLPLASICVCGNSTKHTPS